jgi:hypothetical protein
MALNGMKKLFALLSLLLVAALFSAGSAPADKILPLHGRVMVVTHHADYDVRVVTSHPDLRVQKVQHHPNKPGQWQFVDHHPDFTIQYVTHHPGRP